MMGGGVSMDSEHQETQYSKGRRIFTFLFFFVILLVVLGGFTLLQRRAQYQALAKETETLAIPTVAVIHPTAEAAQEDLVLPGTLQAYVQSSEANVRRLEELESFKHIYAPFSGVITRRNVDIGTLINAGNGGSSQQLFFLAQTDPIRVYLNVPETSAPSVRTGLGAYLDLTQYPGQPFEGKVVRTAEAIDPATRTLLTEVDVPNHNGALLPGGYAQVHLQVKVTTARLAVPVNALLFRSEGLRALVVDANHKVHLRPLTIGRDYGTSLEVLQGLQGSDWIVVNPADSLDEGQEVRVKEIAMNAEPAAAPGRPQAPAPASNKQ